MENKTKIEWHIYFFIVLILIILISLLGRIAFWLAGVSFYEFSMKDSEAQIKLLESLKIEAPVVIPPKVIKPHVVPKKVTVKPVQKPKVVHVEDINVPKTNFDIDKLALAVAKAETGNCTTGYWVTHNNCHWIKSGNTYPCKTRSGSRMCVFKDTEESFTAFKVIWGKWYKKMPNLVSANAWTGKDRAVTWLYNVNHHYNK